MSKITTMTSAGVGSQFTMSIGFGNHVLSVDQYGSQETQWWTEGESVWKNLPQFQDLSTDFNLLGENDVASGNYAIGYDFSREIVFYGSYYTVGLVSCGFDSSGTITPISSNSATGYTLIGKIGVDEVNRLLFVVGNGNRLFCFGYDDNGDNLTLLDTNTFPGSAVDLDIDPIRNFIFVADRQTSKGLSSYSYIPSGVNKGQITQVHNYATSNHGYNSVVIDYTNLKIVASHDYMNSPQGIETLSYDLSANLSLIDTGVPPSGPDYGDSVTVDWGKKLVFFSFYASSVSRMVVFSLDLSYNLTPVIEEVVAGNGALSIDTVKQYVFIAAANPGVGVSIHYNDTGTTLTQIDSRSVGSTPWFCMAVPDYDFVFFSTQWSGLRSYSYLSYIERKWEYFCEFEGDLYGAAEGNLARLDYVGPGWSTTKIADYKSSGTSENFINSMTEHDGRIYGSGSGDLYRTNATFDEWEQVAPIYPGPPYALYWMAELTSFSGKLWATNGSRTYRLNDAGDAWEEAIGPAAGSQLRFGLHKSRFYMTASGGSNGLLYVMNDTEDAWVLLGAAASYVVSAPTSCNGFLYFGTYNIGYGGTGAVQYYLENKSIIRYVGYPYTGIYPSPARYVHAPAVLNNKVYFCGGPSLYRVDLTFPCVTNMFLWEEDQYFYGWIGPGLGRDAPDTSENICVDTIHPARSADGITWDEIYMTELCGPQWQVDRVPWTYQKGNYAPLTIWADFGGYLYSGANRLTEAVGSYATISRSSDGVNWAEVLYVSDLRSTVRSFIVFEGNLYVAVEVMVAGVGNVSTHTISRIYRTSDGVSWNLIKTFDDGDGTFSIVDSFVEHNNQLYMAMSEYVYVSNDGINWANTQGYLGTEYSERNNPNSIAKNGNVLFYASDTN